MAGNFLKILMFIIKLRMLCRIVISFENPATGMEEIIVSEKYGRNVDSYIKEKCVNVPYFPGREYRIEI